MRAIRHLGWVTLALLVAMPASVTSLKAKANPQVEEDPVSGYDSTQLSDLEIETLLLEGRVVDRENLDVGVTLPERLWLERDGHRVSAAFKHLDYERKGLTEFERAPPELNFKDSYRYERAAYLLDRLLGLGMVPVTVLRRVQGKEGALVAWVEDAITEQERLRLPGPGLDGQDRRCLPLEKSGQPHRRRLGRGGRLQLQQRQQGQLEP